MAAPQELAERLAGLEHVLVDLPFLNSDAYEFSSTALQEALAMPHQPGHLSDLAAIATAGAYADPAQVDGSHGLVTG